VAFRNVDFTLDDSHMTGNAAIKDIKTRAMSFDLSLDKLDADRYLPPQQLGTPDKPREALDLDNVGVPLRTLRVLDLQAHLHVGALTLLGAKATDFDVTLATQGGQLAIKPFSAKLYDGSLTGDLAIDARESNGDQPLVTEDLELKGVQMAGLGQDLLSSAKFSGALDLTATLRAQGRIFRELRRSVNGRVTYAVKDGALEGVSVWDAIADGYARAQGKTATASGAPRTEFTDLHGTANLSHGVMYDKAFSGTLPSLVLSGSGKLDLADLTVDYSLKGRVMGRPLAGGAALKGATLPMHVTGTLGSLKVQPDVSGLATPKSAAATDAGHGGE
jgi:AsmA protein